MSGMAINDVNLAGTNVSNVNLSGVAIKNANFSYAIINHVHLFGTEFHNVVLPQEGDGNFDANGDYKPIRFQNCDLSKGQLLNCNLTNMEITNCDITGLKINGILVEDLIKSREGNSV
jgi:uncharacterized protein YjbI with pentapeptide repeats